MKLNDFLLARLAEDEQVARAAGAGDLRWSLFESDVSSQPRSWRVRSATQGRPVVVVDDDDEAVAEAVAAHITGHDPARVLAVPYADHPDYRPEWHPDYGG